MLLTSEIVNYLNLESSKIKLKTAVDAGRAATTWTKHGKPPVLMMHEIIVRLLNKLEWKQIGGHGVLELMEEYIPGADGSTKGSTYVDLTLQKTVRGITTEVTLRIQTQTTTTLKSLKPTARESAAAARIQGRYPNGILITILKSIIYRSSQP